MEGTVILMYPFAITDSPGRTPATALHEESSNSTLQRFKISRLGPNVEQTAVFQNDSINDSIIHVPESSMGLSIQCDWSRRRTIGPGLNTRFDVQSDNINAATAPIPKRMIFRVCFSMIEPLCYASKPGSPNLEAGIYCCE